MSTLEDSIRWRTRPIKAIRAGLVVLVVVIALLWQAAPASAESFPGEPFNGLQVFYSVSGASLGSPVDEPGFTWQRTLTGTLQGGRLEVSGNVIASWGYGAGVQVDVSVDGQSDTFGASWTKEGEGDAWNQPFTVGVDIPDGAQSGSFSVSLTGDYNAGSRGVVVQGTFTGAGAGEGTGSAGGDSPADGSSDGAAGGSAVSGEDGGGASPWRTVTGGLAAIAAAAAAIAGAAAKAAAAEGRELDPNKPVGYVFHLSRRKLQISGRQSAPLEATVYKVMPDGSALPAEDAVITAQPPPGVALQPGNATTQLDTLAWQTGAVQPGAQLLLTATAAQGGTSAAVEVTVEEEAKLEVGFEPADKRVLAANGSDAVTVVGTVELAAEYLADPSVDVGAVRQSIDFSAESEWIDMSVAVDWPGVARAVRVQASQPDPTHRVQPPESVSISVTATVGQQQLRKTVAIPLARLPEIEAAPDTFTFSAQSGETAESRVWVENGGEGVEWSFDHAWRDESSALAQVSSEKTGPTSCTLTLTESAGDALDPSRPESSATLRVVASADGYEDLERYIKVIVAQEGLFVDPIGRHPEDGLYRVAADGSAKITEIDFRVYVRDPASGRVAADLGLAATVDLAPEGREGSPGRAMLENGAVRWEPGGTRQLNDPAAIVKLMSPRKLPTGGKVLPAGLRASIPSQSDEKFSALVSLGLLGVDTEPYSAEWRTELERCRRVIDEYVPQEHRDRLHKLLDERAKTFGAEGLYEMRHKLWSFAHDQLVKEAHEYLDQAWWYEQTEAVLDWVSWCGDIAFGVATGSLVGSAAVVGLGLLKPMLVSAVECWIYNRPLEEWAWQQVGILGSVVEGAATDVDLIKMLGARAPLAWAGFLAYYFAKELYNDPEVSVANAMRNVARMVRDEALVIFLRRVTGVKPGVHPGAAADGPSGPRKPGAAAADTPAGPRKLGTQADTPAGPRKPGTPADTPGGPAKPKTGPGTSAEPPASTRPHPEGDGAAAKPDSGAKPDPDATTGPGKPKPEPADPHGKKPDAPEKKPDRPKPDGPEKKPDTPEKKPDAPPDHAPSGGADARRRGRETATKVRESIRTEGGKKKIPPELVAEIMRDPDAAREMRKVDPKAYKAYDDTRQGMRREHDAKLTEAVKSRPEFKDKKIKVLTVGTEGGIDRDFRVVMEVPDPRNPGKTMDIEIPKEKWAGDSHKIFAEQTGGPSDPAGSAQWADRHQQLATDGYHGEAAVDMADQAWHTNPDGSRTRVQVTPQVEMVKNGQGTLRDPDGLGKTYETKVAESSKHGKLDGYTQAKKACDTLDKVREGYNMQGYDLPDLDPKLKQGMNIVELTAKGDLTPAEADRMLAQNNLGSLEQFMGKVSTQFASLKWAKAR